jgi:hypothetical protein
MVCKPSCRTSLVNGMSSSLCLFRTLPEVSKGTCDRWRAGSCLHFVFSLLTSRWFGFPIHRISSCKMILVSRHQHCCTTKRGHQQWRPRYESSAFASHYTHLASISTLCISYLLVPGCPWRSVFDFENEGQYSNITNARLSCKSNRHIRGSSSYAWFLNLAIGCI